MEEQEKNYMEKVMYWLPTIIFNILETCIIFLVGILLKVPMYDILCIIFIFAIARRLIGEDKHYKSPWRCLVWSTIIFASLFIVSKVGTLMYIIMTIFSAYILSGKADIQKDEKYNKKENARTYLWKKSRDDSKYKIIEEYIKENKDTEQIVNFETALNNIDDEYYEIYKLRFYDNKTLNYIADQLDIGSTARVSERLDNIQNILLGYVQGKELIKK